MTCQFHLPEAVSQDASVCGSQRPLPSLTKTHWSNSRRQIASNNSTSLFLHPCRISWQNILMKKSLLTNSRKMSWLNSMTISTCQSPSLSLSGSSEINMTSPRRRPTIWPKHALRRLKKLVPKIRMKTLYWTNLCRLYPKILIFLNNFKKSSASSHALPTSMLGMKSRRPRSWSLTAARKNPRSLMTTKMMRKKSIINLVI